MNKPVSGESLFGLPIATQDGLSRILVEHGDGRWSICLVRKALKEQFPNRPVDAECSFSLEELVETACTAFSSDPKIADDKHAGRKLAAGVLMLARAMGLTNTEEKQP